jgi:succinylglutamate desuccinylase
MESLKIIDFIPEKLLTCEITELHDILGGPTILDIKGESSDDVLFISTVLHANETTSFLVLQKLLQDFMQAPPKRDVVIFVGNTIAAKEGLRHLPDQPDFNRIWVEGATPEHKIAKQVIDYAEGLNLMANIDIHNNTGNNPFYACVNMIEELYLKLARAFSKRIVFFTEPTEVQSMRFAHMCPSVTLEAGIPGNERATKEVYDYVNKILNLDSLDVLPLENDYELYHTVARIKVDKGANITFDSTEQNIDILLREDIDELNFKELEIGLDLGEIHSKGPITIINNRKQVVTSEYFDISEHHIKLVKPFVPAMFTKDIYVMKEDCLGYVMTKMDVKF